MTISNPFSLFTKPWPHRSIDELGEMAHWLGFDGIELPVRPGFPVSPENMAVELPRAVKRLAEHQVKIFSVAGAATEAMAAACADAGVPTIRIMAPIGADGYLAMEKRLRGDLEKIAPTLEKLGVRIGVQNHEGSYLCHAMGLRNLLHDLDPRYFGAIWDAAHNALQGEEPEYAIELVWSHLCMVNLKNAVWKRRNSPEEPIPKWGAYWTLGRDGLASWSRVAAELKRRAYRGVICLPAEYSEEDKVDALIRQDIQYARSLFV